jgi:hypothetical protein
MPAPRQLIFLATTEADLHEPDLTARALDDIRTHGFDGIYLEYRNLKTPLEAPRTRTGIARIVAQAHERGLAVALDVSANHLQPHLVREHPEAFVEALKPHWLRAVGGRTELVTGGELLHQAIEGVWSVHRQVDGRATMRRVDWHVADCLIEGGGCAMTEQRGIAPTRRTIEVEAPDGELLVVVRNRYAYEFRDLGHPATVAAIDRLGEMFGGISPWAWFWDEPHHGFAFFDGDGRSGGQHIESAYAQRTGHRLVDDLPHLWLDVAGADSAAVRLAYAETLEDGLAASEDALLALARPRGLEVGMHRTMHEELSDDLHIGCVDYFRHNHATTGGYTDAVFEREDSCVAMIHLARALGLRSPTGQAWHNSWGFNPTDAHLAYYLRLMGAMGVRWVGHTYRWSMLFGPGYPHHPTWAGMPGHLAAHRELLDAIDGAVAEASTAVIYTWRAMAGVTGNYIHVHRRNLMFTMLELTLHGVQATIADATELAGATVQDGAWQLHGAAIRRVIVPWTHGLAPEEWDGLDRFAAAGIEIILCGPPPQDAGWARFAALVGAPARPVERRHAIGERLLVAGSDVTADPAALVPNWRSNPANTYPDQLKAWNPAMLQRGTVAWHGCELPHLPGTLARLCPRDVELPDGLIGIVWRRGNQRLLAVVARHGLPFTGRVRWQGREHRLDGARHAVLSGPDPAPV